MQRLTSGSILSVRPPPNPLSRAAPSAVQRVAAVRGRLPILTFGGRLDGFVLPPALAGAVVTTIVPPRQLTILPSTKILALVDWDVVTVFVRLGTPTALVVVDRERVGGRRGQGDNSQGADERRCVLEAGQVDLIIGGIPLVGC